MLKILTTLAMLLGFTTSAVADYTFVVPQKPGGGTSVWAQIVATEMEKYLDEKIVIKHIRGARDIPGFNKWHNDMRDDDKVVMVSHGGNGVSFLNEKVDYDYNEYDSVGLMNLNIIVAVGANHNPYGGKKTSFAAGSGQIPEGIAITLLKCGAGLTTQQYIDCFKRRVSWIKGMKGGQRRLAFKRGELDGTRENPAAFKKHVQPVIDKGLAGLWFHHGILQPDGSHADDPNYPDIQMEDLFYAANRTKPESDLYAAYKLVKSFRDGMQKALWVAKGNPNKAKLIAALEKVATTPESIKAVQKKVGQYDWLIGKAGDAHRDTLMKLITPKALKTLVTFNNEAFGIKAVYKDALVAQK
jgi:hypothetical protein|tara:strand:+ start:394 stop:1461 length:1068 start_codon:yes stop_codon:yes gene_type:complete